MNIHFRNQIKAADVTTVLKILEATGLFTQAEIRIAIELMEEHLTKGTQSGYFFLFTEDDTGEVFGYSCFGPIPCTKESFDLYWIAVLPEHQRQGIGKRLIEETQRMISSMGGTRIYIETSSRKQYEHTRSFYLKSGYSAEAVFKDFYSPGDDKIVFCKALSPAQSLQSQSV
jgi:ribosomal protein S18 acetylase RimI-like enzyme